MPITELTESESPLQLSDAPIVEYALGRITERQLEGKVINLTLLSIVTVHGLYENAIDTWTDPETAILWLRDLFPHQHLKARVLVYSYESEALTSAGGGAGILSYATTLVAELCANRQMDDGFERPIIFVCHDLGGLLVKRALAYSSKRQGKAINQRSIYTSTYAILFMGTPHNGIDRKALLLPRTDESPGLSQFMINLLKGSGTLQEITDQFAPLMKRFSIYNFWEQMETWAGDVKAYIVSEESAAPVWDDVERCGIMATHSRMVKFRSHKDYGYRVVLEALIRYIRLAPRLIQTRWVSDLESRAIEREREVEALRQPQLLHSLSEDAIAADFNELFIVPHWPSNYFTGRRMDARFVKEKLNPSKRQLTKNTQNIFDIYGLGGSGKTQFCLKYIQDNRSRYGLLQCFLESLKFLLTAHLSYWGVFWIDASNENRARLGFASLGQQAGKGDTFEAGMHWLSRCSKPWLLVIDNADDPDMDVSQYFPTGGNGYILITTRNPGATIHATVGQIQFRSMDPEEAITLLLKHAYPQDESEHLKPQNRKLAQGIASELGYLALALAHAGTTIRRNIYTLEKYLHYYLGHRKEMISSSLCTSVDETNIITTWEIPFEKIRTRESVEHRDAVDLLYIFAFMHFDSIPETIFQRSWNDIKVSKSQYVTYPGILQIESGWNEEAQARLRRALRVLYDYSIIDHEPDKGICSLHPVVQGWARSRLKEAEQQRCLSYTTAVLAHCISPYLEASGRRFRRQLLPHIDSCLQALKSQYPSLPDTVERAAVVEKFAWVYAENGGWKEARKLQREVVNLRAKMLGRWHKDIIEAQRSLGHTCWNLFEPKVEEAIENQRQVLESEWWSRPSLAYWMAWPPWKPRHIAYCFALDDLTCTLWLAGNREMSKKAGEAAVEGLLKRLGPDDPKTLTAIFNLARTYLHLGDQKTSHKLLIWVLRKRKRYFGLEHPDTLITRNEVGLSFYAGKKQLAIAERLVTNVLISRRKILGEDHAYTWWSTNDLSRILCERGRGEMAAAMLEEIIPVVAKTLGEDHVGMSMTRANLARAYYFCKRWTEMEELCQRLLAQIPSGHPDWIHIMSGFVYARIQQGHLDEAEKDCIQMLKMITQTKVLALDHPRTITIAEQLSRLYRKQNRLDEIAVPKKRVPAMDENSIIERFDIWPAQKTPGDVSPQVTSLGNKMT